MADGRPVSITPPPFTSRWSPSSPIGRPSSPVFWLVEPYKRLSSRIVHVFHNSRWSLPEMTIPEYKLTCRVDVVVAFDASNVSSELSPWRLWCNRSLVFRFLPRGTCTSRRRMGISIAFLNVTGCRFRSSFAPRVALPVIRRFNLSPVHAFGHPSIEIWKKVAQRCGHRLSASYSFACW